jgi:hypothetical protein
VKRLIVLALAVVAAATIAAVALGQGDRTAKGKQPPHGSLPVGHALDHVFVIMLENHSQSSVIGDANAPYITGLAHTYAEATSYYGVTHPSEPNYVAAISGSNWGLNADVPTYEYAHTNIVDQLEGAHLTWAAYMDSMPTVGDATDQQYPANAALYVNKHNPFVLFTDIKSSPARLKQIKPYTQFAADMQSKDVPDFVWISPNQCHDMHGGVYSQIAADGSDGTPCPYGSTKDDANDAALKQKADAFVKGAVTAIMASPAWKTSRSAIFVLTDENDFTGTSSTDGWESADGCCDSPYLPQGTQFLGSNGKPDGTVWQGGIYGGGKIPAIVVTSRGKRGFTSDKPYNHYSLLATIEWNWGLSYLGNASDTAQVQPMTEFLTK